MPRKQIQPVVNFDALTPEDVFNNLKCHYDCDGRLSLSLFGYGLDRIDCDYLNNYNDSAIKIMFKVSSMRRFEEIVCKIGLRPEISGYNYCTDTNLRFFREHKNAERNQNIEIICQVSRYSLHDDQEEFDKRFEGIAFPEDEKEGV